MSLALAAVLVAPPRARPFAAVLGMAFSLSIAFCIVTLGWHFPSDVVGGFLLATGWSLVIAAGLRSANERWPEHAGRTRASATLQRGVDGIATFGTAALVLLLVVVVVVVAATLVVTRPSDLVDFADRAHRARGGGRRDRLRCGRAARRCHRRVAAFLTAAPPRGDMLAGE